MAAKSEKEKKPIVPYLSLCSLRRIYMEKNPSVVCRIRISYESVLTLKLF